MTKKNNGLNDAFDILLDQAAERAAEHLGQSLPDSEEPVEFSAEHEEKMQRLFKQERAKRRRKNTMKYAKIAACLLAVLIVGAGITISSVDAWRVKFMNYVFDFSQPNTDISFSEQEGTEYKDEEITLGYVPSGFALTEKEGDRQSFTLLFTSENQYFHILLEGVDSKFSLDTEQSSEEKTTVNGYEATYTANQNINSLIWHNSKYVFTIYGNISKEEIFKIAEKIEKK